MKIINYNKTEGIVDLKNNEKKNLLKIGLKR